jgi:hypothetical protein
VDGRGHATTLLTGLRASAIVWLVSGRVVCIVGMHRSGTSCLAGSLQEAGLHLGDVITAAPHNAKGNRENKRIMDLNEAVLVHSGGSWDSPPRAVRWTGAHSQARDAIVASYGDVPRWGFKDPRTLVLLDFWRERLGELTFVGTFRHPQLVAESLLRRNGGSLDRWFALWSEYTERLLALHAATPFPIVRFDVAEDVYKRSLLKVAAHLGLGVPGELGFFEAALRHQNADTPVELPPRVARAYAALCERALTA